MPRHAPLSWNPDFASRSVLFAPLLPVAEALRWLNHWPDLATLDALFKSSARPIVTGSALPVHLVASASRVDTGYEAGVFLSGALQTREASWHDLLNVLVWLTFPRAKAALNARHFATPPGSVATTKNRTSTSDALTLFDESGIIVASSDPELLHLLRAFAWKDLFWNKREEVSACMRFVIFGHGLYEQSLQPFIGLTGKALLVKVEETFFATSLAGQLRHLDERAAAALSDTERFLGTRELAPLPILGIPGWWDANNVATFYDDGNYFRSRRRDRVPGSPAA